MGVGRSFGWITAMVILISCGFVGSMHAAPPRLCEDGTRPPCDDGAGGGDVPDFGDLIYLYRDDNGVPILDANQCQQPIGFNSDLCSAEVLDCTGADPCLVPVDPLTCAVDPAYATCTREIEFGRISEARSSDQVFASQLEEVIVSLATSDCVTLDPAGRLVTSRVVDDVVTTSEIDSPLQNLAMYKQLIQAGFLGAEASPIPLPQGALTTAARALGAGSDKTGQVDVDLVVYLNQVMGLSDPSTPTILPKLCIDVKEEVQGTVQLVEKCFLNYGAYNYNRSNNFGGLPAPAYIPANPMPMDGWFEYLVDLHTIPPTFGIDQGPILQAVFDGDDGFTGGNVGGFAQAADDARAVIEFMHNWAVPADYVTPVPCEASADENYDVSISPLSGLQVPTQMVDGGEEGREFVVTVSNVGPDGASGAVTVTAVAASGGVIVGSPWVFPFADLVPGASQSWVQIFTTNLGVRTTINWTATVTAADDVNPSNNTVQATTNVKVTGSGAGSGGSGGGPGGRN